MKLDWKTCAKIGVSAFLLYLCITYWPHFTGLLSALLSAATPLLLGCALAYVLNILMSFYEKHYFTHSVSPAVRKSRRPVCMLAAFITLAAGLILILNLVLPELLSCVNLLLRQIPTAANSLANWLGTMDAVPEDLLASLRNVDWASKLEQIISFLTTGFGNIIGTAVSAVSSVFSGLVTALFALIFSIYLLLGKERLGSQFNRIMKRYMSTVSVPMSTMCSLCSMSASTNISSASARRRLFSADSVRSEC
ncbi:AI-2E family transporter [Pseudoflavonifractor capillosus]|uniref:AI-2E family transporter n=1 Tax=Pseudoflavonifractor capillosus TaxID=106588 RepID=UPI0023F7E806|nr:AI-2E family transporter [Pseudoflavonifractor capillosus]